jgi:hypothetical protein
MKHMLRPVREKKEIKTVFSSLHIMVAATPHQAWRVNIAKELSRLQVPQHQDYKGRKTQLTLALNLKSKRLLKVALSMIVALDMNAKLSCGGWSNPTNFSILQHTTNDQ